jgi:hypothetical protein
MYSGLTAEIAETAEKEKKEAEIETEASLFDPV